MLLLAVNISAQTINGLNPDGENTYIKTNYDGDLLYGGSRMQYVDVIFDSASTESAVITLNEGEFLSQLLVPSSWCDSIYFKVYDDIDSAYTLTFYGCTYYAIGDSSMYTAIPLNPLVFYGSNKISLVANVAPSETDTLKAVRRAY
jgi:hypothetical protein